MPEEAIYIVSYSDPETYSPEYVIGPVVQDWEAYCKSLMAETEKRAIELASVGNMDHGGHMNTWNSPIYHNDLADALVDVLLTKGYRKIQFPSYDIGWQDEDEVDDYPAVVLHNHQHEIESQEGFIRDRLADGAKPEDMTYYKEKAEESAEQIRKLGGVPKIDKELLDKIPKDSDDNA
jgi:hypothetical protein